MAKNTEAKAVTAKVPPHLLDVIDGLVAQQKREGVTLKQSQALVALALRGAGLAEQPRERRKVG